MALHFGCGTAAQRLAQKLAGWRAARAAAVTCRRWPCVPVAARRSTPRMDAARPARRGRRNLPCRRSFAWPSSLGRARLIVLGFVLTLASTTAGPGAAVSDHAAAGQGADPSPERQIRGFLVWPTGISAGWSAAALFWPGCSTGPGCTSWPASANGISADLRARTYAHLQRLSLEFFGGKRTGDLIARIGNDTERLCNFLSLQPRRLRHRHPDDRHDGDRSCCRSIPLLALAALCPFPLIVWMVYRVRGRLLRGYRQAGAAWGAMTSVLADTIPGIRVVKAFAQESREIERFDGQQRARLRGQRPPQPRLVVLRPDGDAADDRRPARRLGVRHLARQSSAPASRSAC